MYISGDYHLHTYASDGRASVKDHALAAKARGLKEIAITDHSFSTLFCNMTEKKFGKQSAEINELSGDDLKIYQGIEGNIIGNRLDVPPSIIRKLDVLLVGFHRYVTLFKTTKEERKFLLTNGFSSEKNKEKLAVYNTEAFVSVLEKYPVDVIAHLGHRTPLHFERIFECAAHNGTYIELNEKHIETLEAHIDGAINSGVKFIIGSDSHKKNRIGEFRRVEEFIKKYSVPLERVFGTDGNKPEFKDKKGWQFVV